MNTLSFRTESIRKEDVKRNWHIIDAQGMIVGRMASKIATILRGKHKPSFTPHIDCGDYVIVINADKVRFTGNKMQNKEYITYTGYPGGQRRITPYKMMQRKPYYIIEHAVRGMLPKTKLGRAMFKKLFVYPDPNMPQRPTTPQPLAI